MPLCGRRESRFCGQRAVAVKRMTATWFDRPGFGADGIP
jgi:hypothetical protein